MAALPTRSHAAIVAVIAAGMQGRVARFLNFATGGVLLAMAEAFAGVCLWLQALVLQVLAMGRAATSTGADLDSWVADFGVVRLPAQLSIGVVTFTRYTAGPTTPVIPVGTLVQTATGDQRFVVFGDPGNAAYSASAGGYVMPSNIANLPVPVQAAVPGAAGNVVAGAISLLASAVSGVDAVTNGAALTAGADGESDAGLRERFVLFINALSRATVPAVVKAVRDLAPNARCSVLDGQRADGTLEPGLVTVIVDDGSGSPTPAFVLMALDAVGQVRAAGIRHAVIAVMRVTADVRLIIEVAPGYYAPDVRAAVVGTLTLYINGLGIGVPLRHSRLEQMAYNASPGVTNVTAVTLNGGTADLIPGPAGTVKVGPSGITVD